MSLLLVNLHGMKGKSQLHTKGVGSYAYGNFDTSLSCRGFVVGWIFIVGHLEPQIAIDSRAYVTDLDIAAAEKKRQLDVFIQAYFKQDPDVLLRSAVDFDIEQGHYKVRPFQINDGARTDFESTITVKGYSKMHGLVGVQCLERSDESDSFRVSNSRPR